jgi:D-3-phosphoglycerate dehydrogenase
MNGGVPRLTYFEEWTDPVANEILEKAPAASSHAPPVEIVRLAVNGDVEGNWKVLERTHGYQALIRTATYKRPGVAGQWLPGAALVARCSDLLAVCSAGAGYDVVDVEACTDAGVVVCNNSGPGAEAVAEHALGFMLDLAKRITAADRSMRRTQINDRSFLRGTELEKKTIGIIGLGRIGTRLVELCRPFHMEVLAFDPMLSETEVAAKGATAVTLRQLLERADFVQVTCPLTPETEGLIGAAQFATMKPEAFFVTTARGPVHDEKALYEALRSGAIAGAGVDVFHDEPPPADHPLLTLDNVVVSPHTAGITVEAARAIAIATAHQWLTIFAGLVPPRLLNAAAWPRYRERFHSLLGRWPTTLDP